MPSLPLLLVLLSAASPAAADSTPRGARVVAEARAEIISAVRIDLASADAAPSVPKEQPMMQRRTRKDGGMEIAFQ